MEFSTDLPYFLKAVNNSFQSSISKVYPDYTYSIALRIIFCTILTHQGHIKSKSSIFSGPTSDDKIKQFSPVKIFLVI